jgi:hypothetical protein
MSQYLINDQAELYKNAKELITRFESTNTDPGELITCEKSKTPEQIRKAYIRSNFDPLIKAQEKGSVYVRSFYNSKNLRGRLYRNENFIISFNPRNFD